MTTSIESFELKKTEVETEEKDQRKMGARQCHGAMATCHAAVFWFER
jgi:hypothetical protein